MLILLVKIVSVSANIGLKAANERENVTKNTFQVNIRIALAGARLLQITNVFRSFIGSQWL